MTEEELWEAQNKRLDGLHLLTNRHVLYGEVSLPLWRRLYYRLMFFLRIW